MKEKKWIRDTGYQKLNFLTEDGVSQGVIEHLDYIGDCLYLFTTDNLWLFDEQAQSFKKIF